MVSVLREGDPIQIEPPIAWVGLAMAHKTEHEIASAFETEQNELMEAEKLALYNLKQAVAENPDDVVQWHQLGLQSLCSLQFKTSQNYLKAACCCWPIFFQPNPRPNDEKEVEAQLNAPSSICFLTYSDDVVFKPYQIMVADSEFPSNLATADWLFSSELYVI